MEHNVGGAIEHLIRIMFPFLHSICLLGEFKKTNEIVLSLIFD